MTIASPPAEAVRRWQSAILAPARKNRADCLLSRQDTQDPVERIDRRESR